MSFGIIIDISNINRHIENCSHSNTAMIVMVYTREMPCCESLGIGYALLCVCIYLYIHIYIYVCISVYFYIHTKTYIYIYIYIHIYIDIDARTYMHTHTHTHTRAHVICLCVYIYIYVYICTSLLACLLPWFTYAIILRLLICTDGCIHTHTNPLNAGHKSDINSDVRASLVRGR